MERTFFNLKHGPTKLYTSHNTRREPNLIGREEGPNSATVPNQLLFGSPSQQLSIHVWKEQHFSRSKISSNNIIHEKSRQLSRALKK
ncbi:hypothetical protein OUZ56_014017 [Daphnia magna]|uniref:Uncharacterized protein n=1 Tax=Daphnia magna TaxID=35525 RepID=A0ABQ9Z7M2_9CRUS|nr:hypothetical protein OUZ56_014017 [Daphnia magna]